MNDMKNQFYYFTFHKTHCILGKLCNIKNCMDLEGQTEILVPDSCFCSGTLPDGLKLVHEKMQVEQQDETREATYVQTKH